MGKVCDISGFDEMILKNICGQDGEILSNDGRRSARKKVATKEEKNGDIEVLLSIMEAAKKCGISRHQIDNAINSGELPFYSFGERRKIKISDLKKWLESKRTVIGYLL